MPSLSSPAPRPTIAGVRRLTLATVVALTAIVATGGAVRLTQSGLGCDSWPDCGRAEGWHALVEYGNRIAGAAVGVLVLAALVAVHRLSPRRPDLRRLSWALVAGFAAQAALGAVSVTLKLPPAIVVAHFLLSMLLVAIAAVLHFRAGSPAAAAPAIRSELRWLAVGLVVGTAIVIALGTLTTGTGPHSGADPTQAAPRFTFLPLHIISMVHGNAAILVVGLAIADLLVARITGAGAAMVRRGRLVVAAVVLQAVIGITQYALGLPRGLVDAHLVGATVLWLAVLFNMLEVGRAPRAAVVERAPVIDAPARA